MCGIIVTRNEERLNWIKHRGVTSSFYECSDPLSLKNWFCGHYLLPFQTKLLSGGQPIWIDKNHLFMFNGEIFNYPSKYESDTEYLSEYVFKKYTSPFEIMSSQFAYEASKWDGFWAIVVYEVTSGRFVCITDPLGKKQLYINKRGEICSEIAPLTRNHSLRDDSYFSTIRKWGYNINNKTPFTDIKRLPPGTISIVSGRMVTSRDYYNWNDYQPIQKHNMKKIRNLISQSVERRLISKIYPISCLVSGGLDSTIILHELESLNADVTYFTIDNASDNSYIDSLEQWYGIKIKHLEVEDYDLLDILRMNETPVDLGSMVPQYLLFNAIKKEGFKLTLSGDGADELFGGYKRINQYDSQLSDIFDELPYYHHVRLDRMSMGHTIELRSPFLGHDVVRMALDIPLEWRKNKYVLKSIYANELPPHIIKRPKEPLKTEAIRKNKILWRSRIIDLYKSVVFEKMKLKLEIDNNESERTKIIRNG